MKKFLLIFALITLCSCGDEYKAKRFVKNLEGDSYFLFQDIDDNGAYVYYMQNFTFYKYDVRTEETQQLFILNNGEKSLLGDNCQAGGSDIFYLDENRNVIRHNLRSNTTTCINDNNGIHYDFVARWYHHLIFYDRDNLKHCDARILDYDALTSEFKYVTFDNIDKEYKKCFVPLLVVGYHGLIVILSPENMEDGMDLYTYLYHYKFTEPSYSGTLETLCQSNKIWMSKQGENWRILTEKDYNTTAVYDMYGKVIKEFPTIYGWDDRRGLNSGNIIARSSRHNISCYIANDDNNLISSINVYYYDGNTGEEVKLNEFFNPEGEKVSYVLGSQARKDIHIARDNAGLVFYGETDWMNEYTLLYFDFASRKTSVIDRGSYIEYTDNLYKLEHHNGSVAWYDKDGYVTQPPRKKDHNYFYDMGAAWGELLNW